MAALKQVCIDHKDEFACGIAWVAVWKTGRSWHAEAFYNEDGSYDEGYVFEEEDMERMREIIAEDHKAVMLNGYYSNCGVPEEDPLVIADLVAGVEWNYLSRFNQLWSFYDGMVIKGGEQ